MVEAALIVLFAIAAISAILFVGFLAACRRIRRTDRWGTLRPESLTRHRRHMLAYASRWDEKLDDNTPAYV
jgi:hypothetical protein